MKKILWLMLIILIPFLSCNEDGPSEPTNNAPKIQKVSASPSSTKIDESTILTCVATDADGDYLSYTWSAEEGEFVNGTVGTSVVWKSPNVVGIYNIEVLVSDGEKTDSKVITINSNDDYGQLSGTIWDKDTGEGVGGVQIYISDKMVLTDTNGHYQMPNLSEGTYRIIAEKEHYIPFESEINFSNVDKVFDISLEYLLSDLSGVVKDNISGELLGNVKINFDGHEFITNETGHYEYLGFERGLYKIEAEKDIKWHNPFDETIAITNRSEVYDIELESKSCLESPTVTHLGKTYNTVKIGDRCWMKENLNTGTIVNGDVESSDNGIIEKYCYNNDETNCETYGGLYQWDEIIRHIGGEGENRLCPEGWHVPSLGEFEILEREVNNSSNALKDKSQGSEEGIGTNTSGFSILLGGSRSRSGDFYGINNSASFWMIREAFPGYALSLLIEKNTDKIHFPSYYKEYGFSIRCVKDRGT